MSVSSNDLKNGMSLNLPEGLMTVVEFQHVKPGKGGAFVRTKLKNFRTGAVIDRTFRGDEKLPLAVIDKRRSPDDGTAEVMNVIGDIRGRTCVIADDIIDTAGTIQKAAQALKESGAERVLACAVHGVLSGPAIERIEKSPIDKLIVTNTIPLEDKRAKCDKIVELSVARLLGQAIRSIHEETSVSSLFV